MKNRAMLAKLRHLKAVWKRENRPEEKEKKKPREMVKTKASKQKQKQGNKCTHVKETKTETNKTKSKRTTRQIELKNEIRQLGLKLTKTHNLKTKPKQCAN